MDYLVAGLCAVLLFFYLIYALLKPEAILAGALKDPTQ